MRAKRAMLTFWVDKSKLKMPKIVHFGEFLKTWSLRSNSVTRQVIFNRTKIGRKRQNSKFQMRHFKWFSNNVKKVEWTRPEGPREYFIFSYHQIVAGNQLVDDSGIMISFALHLVVSKGPNHQCGYQSQKVQNGWWDLDPNGTERILKKVGFFKCNHEFILPCIIEVYCKNVSINRFFGDLLQKIW